MKFLKPLLAVILGAASLVSAQVPSPTKPHADVAPAVYGAIDLGSKGTKSSLFSFETDEEGITPNLLFSKTINTKLVSSMVDGKFTQAGIDDATNAVKTLVADMKAAALAKGLAVTDFYIIGSSGVAKGKNKEELVASVKEATNLDMDFIDAFHEGYYATTSAIPASRRGTSMYVDLGSGNTRLGCLVGGESAENYKGAEIPYGSVSGRNEALKRNPGDIVAGVDAVMTDVKAAYDRQSLDTPCLRNRKYIYWGGGAAWATATYMHPEAALRGYVIITRKDIDDFLASLKDNSWTRKKVAPVFPPKMSESRQQAIRAAALKDHDDVQNVFVREDLIAGVSIMKTVLESSNPNASVRFVRSGSYVYGATLAKFLSAQASGASK
jgi:exopolyphosphatase/pppGpp-phosphohydrolase